MSDFDDFFARKLEEEASFPNKGKQWKQMSKRLDAFDAGGVQGNLSKIRWWQAAAAIAVMVSGFLVWKSYDAQQQNKVLRQEIASLQLERTQLAEQMQANAIKSQVSAQASVQIQELNPQAIVSRPDLPQTRSANKQSLPAGTAPKTKNIQSIASDKKNTLKIAEHQSNTQEASPKQPEMPSNMPGKDSAPDITGTNPKALETELDQQKVLLDSLRSRIASLEAEQMKPAAVKDSINTPESAPIADVPALTPAEIKPLKANHTRFKIGIQGTLGFVQPKQAGVSSIRGQGFTFEAKVFKNLWLNASVDWLKHEVCTKEFVPKFHPHHDTLPKPPDNNGGGGGGWPHPDKLVQVESAPNQQQFGLGLRYEIPVKFWLRPSVRVAHVFAHLASSSITYKYEEDAPGGPWPNPHPHAPEYAVEKFDNKWISNQWRLGVGLEKDIPNWTFGLWADYSKNLSSATPAFDALYIRAGAQYRF